MDRHPTRTTGQAALPRRRQKPRLAAHPMRRDQPAHPAQARPDPPGRGLGPGLTARGMSTAPLAGIQTTTRLLSAGTTTTLSTPEVRPNRRTDGLLGVLPAPTHPLFSALLGSVRGP